MRVITGTARGMRLKELPGLETRPTTDKVKESLFNIIQFEIEGRSVLDLFGGTGQLGIEALSRGAERCTFVDARREAAALIRENLRPPDWRRRAEWCRGMRSPSSAGAGSGLVSYSWTRPIRPSCWSRLWSWCRRLTFFRNMV